MSRCSPVTKGGTADGLRATVGRDLLSQLQILLRAGSAGTANGDEHDRDERHDREP